MIMNDRRQLLSKMAIAPKGVYATYRKVHRGYVGVIRTPHWSTSIGIVRTNQYDAKNDAQTDLNTMLEGVEND